MAVLDAPSSEEEYDLKRETARGIALLEQLEAGKEKDRVEECVEILGKAWDIGKTLLTGTGDDLADGDLQCVLTAFHLARAMERSPAAGPRDRCNLVERVDAVQREFLRFCSKLELMDHDDAKVWDDQDEEEGRRKKTAAEERAEAIARTKKRDTMKAKFQELKGQADERDAILAEIQYSILRSLDDIRLRRRELEMLRMMAARSPDTKEEPRKAPSSTPEDAWLRAPADGRGLRVLHMSSIDGRLEMSRDRIRAKVFTPDPRRLPTKSLEEYADEELKDALEREQRQKDAANDPANDNRRTKDLHDAGLEDDSTLYDQATDRDEAWDTWREHHPKGAGNKGNHIY